MCSYVCLSIYWSVLFVSSGQRNLLRLRMRNGWLSLRSRWSLGEIFSLLLGTWLSQSLILIFRKQRWCTLTSLNTSWSLQLPLLFQFMDFVKKLASGELGLDDKNEVLASRVHPSTPWDALLFVCVCVCVCLWTLLGCDSQGRQWVGGPVWEGGGVGSNS